VIEQQLDLFEDAGAPPEQPWGSRANRGPAAGELDDDTLVAAIPAARLADCSVLAAEAGRRRLGASVSALEALCRRFIGFGLDRLVPEQAVALGALAAIGGRDSARAVATLIARGVVQGPTLTVAMDAAARLHAVLPADVLRPLLRHLDPRVRANACKLLGGRLELIPALLALLGDAEPMVARSAACALGQTGRSEARPVLIAMLRKAPAEDVIGAASSIADEECIVLLGRIARSAPSLAEAALTALEDIDHPLAGAIAAGVRRPRSSREKREKWSPSEADD
jgi:hypothetical protein